jgi:glycosyltransferase involved in cell wall biosynthesis
MTAHQAIPLPSGKSAERAGCIGAAGVDVALFVPSLEIGGAERVVVMLANEFARRGLRTEVVTACAFGPYRRDLGSEVLATCLGARSVALSLPPLARYLRTRNPAALFCFLNRANIVGLAARRLAGVRLPVVVSERSNLSAGTPFDGGRFGRILPFLMRRAYPSAEAVVAVSQGVADDLSQALAMPRDRIKVVHNPLDFDRISTLAEAEPAHPWLKHKARPVIVSVGRLHPAKDFGTLIRAFSLLRRDRPCRLIILGDGDERSRLEREIQACNLTSDDVDLPGFARNPFAFVKRADLFALSSRFEGFPNALVEAMACGTRIVATDCRSGPFEILEGGRWGRLARVGAAAGLSEALKAALDDPEPPDVVSRARQFTIEASADAYLGLLRTPAEAR